MIFAEQQEARERHGSMAEDAEDSLGEKTPPGANGLQEES